MVLADARLPEAADAVRHARQVAVRALAEEAPGLVDAVALVVTELATNAVLHGAPPVELRVLEVPDGVRVELQDGSRLVPVVPHPSAEAMTGRGLSLVAALSDRWGVDPTAGGKVVWAHVLRTSLLDGTERQTPPAIDVDALLDARPDEERRTTYALHLGAVPTELLLQAKSHIDNVVRELTLARGEATALPAPMAALVEAVTRDFAGARAAIKQQAVAAAERGEATTDLVLDLPAEAADAGARYLAALDEVDTYARAARLLTLETPADQRVFRRWYLQALIDQLRARARGEQPPPPPSLLTAMAGEVRTLSTLREGWERLRLLQKVTGELTAVDAVEDIVETVVGNACTFLGALSGRVLLLGDDGVLRTVAAPGVALPHGYAEVALDADLPGAVVARTRQPLSLRNLGELARRFPALAGLYDSERSLHVAPLCIGDHCLGVFALTFPPDARLDEQAQGEFMAALADALAQALERALAMEAAVHANERLRFLADAAVALSRSLELRDTVTAVGELLVPRLADWCVVQVLQDGRLTTIRAVHTDPAKTAWAEQMAGVYPPRADAPSGAPNVVRTGRSELWPELPAELLEASAVDEEHHRILRSLGLSSALIVPLTGRSGTFGAITLIHADSGRRYSEPDVAFAEDVAHRAALAIETARTLGEQSGRLASVTRVAEAAQHAILAPPPARLSGLALQARYVSASADALVGGDLYEVVVRPGAARLLIGDVKGKGLAAVRTATVVLGEFRAAAADLDDLAEVAVQIDRRLRPYLTDEDFVTATIAEIDDDGRCTVLSCGHPPPILVQDGVARDVQPDAAVPLGLGARPAVTRCRMRRGDRMLLHTDGLLEARDPDGRFVDVPAVIAPVVHGPFDVALDRLLSRLQEVVEHDLGDDLALVLVEYCGRPPTR